MACYQDGNGKQWTLRLTPITGDKVRREVEGVDLQDINTLAKLSDAAKLSRVCYLLAGEPEDYESFADGINGDVLDRMEAALWEEIENFSRSKARPLLRKIREKGEAVKVLAEKQLADQIDSLTPEAILKNLTSGNTAFNSADTSVAIQDV